MNARNENSLFLGCIADDVTGATDLAGNLVKAGMNTVQVFGVPEPGDLARLEADAIVVALKTRTADAKDAIDQSLRSLASLHEAGAQRFFFKYCSTFDSVADGNIGPVAEALLDELKASQTIFCPAFPDNGRTVYQGHLFVQDRLLNESGMENHPLNPMKDPNLVRVLQKQASKKVGLISVGEIETGEIDSAFRLLSQEKPLVIVDALNNGHLQTIAKSVCDLPLVTGGSGIGRWLPQAWREIGLLKSNPLESSGPFGSGRTAVLSGSCSKATNRQVDYFKSRSLAFELDVESLIRFKDEYLTEVLNAIQKLSGDDPILVYSTCGPERLATLREKHDIEQLASSIEHAMGVVAKHLIDEQKVRRLILAGGETSGAVTRHLGIKSIRIGKEICPGVPWTESIGPKPLGLVLKSGNFGEDDFFEAAIEVAA